MLMIDKDKILKIKEIKTEQTYLQIFEQRYYLECAWKTHSTSCGEIWNNKIICCKKCFENFKK